MKTTIVIISTWVFCTSFSQEVKEKTVKTDVNEVTVFIDGAQVIRKKKVELTQGTTILKFADLSPFIDAKSIQVKADGDVMVLAVNHQQNFLNKSTKPENMIDLENQLNGLEDKLKLENTYLDILKAEQSFLYENRNIGGKNEGLSVDNLKAASEYYSARLTSIRLGEIELEKTLKELNRQKSAIENQIKTLTDKKEFPTGEVLVKVNAKRTGPALFEISYLVKNAGWFPSYDIRAESIEKPIQLIYKANVRQDTKVDWKNVKLKFSSADPNVSGVAPELKTYFLSYNVLSPSYGNVLKNVTGRVTGSDGTPLPGVNVIVQGTTIGAVTDVNGNYSIAVPVNAGNLSFSYIGYINEIMPINNSVINVSLVEDLTRLEEVVVVGYGTNKRSDLTGSIFGHDSRKMPTSKIRGTSSLAVPTAQVEKQTTVDFEIKTPYTINSDNKSYSVDMAVYDMPADYQYYCIPKIERSVYLRANITDWEKYNLLEGEANIFFEDTYVGKTLLDVRYTEDTLEISLGIDKKVTVTREKVKDYTAHQFIGNKKEETRVWNTTVKNNKNQKISMVILDQVPVSTLEEIEVGVQNTSGARYNPETGEVQWEFNLSPADKKEFNLKYSVKYPKYRSLVVE